MNPGTHIDGGVTAQRGFLFQTYSLLLYLLIRRLEATDLKIVIEPTEGEDAKLLSSTIESNQIHPLKELVQCKKHESSSSQNFHAGVTKGDEWAAEVINRREFEQWITKPRPHQSAADVLAADDHAYYTAIVFGRAGKEVQSFIPKPLSNIRGIRWYSPQFSKFFPLNYKHPKDPAAGKLPKDTFSTPEIRRRIRVLLVDSPSEIEGQCELLLRQYYEISEDKSAEIVRRLRIEIENRATAKYEGSRCLSSGDIEAILSAGKAKQGRWEEAKKFLETGNLTAADPNRGETPRWVDFENGRYAHRDEFEMAWEALEQQGFVTVSGPAGTGKTTMCRFLAFKYLKENIGQRVYYLSTRPGESLADEKRFFESQLYSNTLFILDDQHLDPGEIDKIADSFIESRRELKSQASLLVASTITYGPTRAISAKFTSSLNQAASIRLLPVGRVVMANILDTLRSKASLRTPLSNDQITLLSSGYLGKAIILARCSRDFGTHKSLQRLLKGDLLGKTLSDWILARLLKEGDYEFFRAEIAPVFLIGSHSLGIKKNLTAAVEALYRAGFLITEDVEIDDDTIFRPISLHLAHVISQRYSKQEFDALSNYLMLYPEQLPAVCERLAVNDQGAVLLRELCQAHFDYIYSIISDNLNPLDLAKISRILRSLHSAARGESNRLLRAIAAPRGSLNINFFSDFVSVNRAKSAAEIKNFLEALYWIDQSLTRRLAKDLLGYAEATFILSLFDFCRLDEIAACLHSLKKCNAKFAGELYDHYIQTPNFEEKVRLTDEDTRGLSIWMRFCEELRSINKTDSYSYLQKHLPPSKILGAILKNPTSSPMILLHRTQRLYPKLAANISLMLWEDHRGLLLQILRSQHDLNALTNDLYVLSRSNRRIAIKSALNIQEHICDLVSTQDRYSKISSAIESLHKNVGLKTARAAGQAINKGPMLSLVQQEDRKIDVVGKFLYCLAEASPEVAAWFEERLEYSSYLERIYSLRLRNLTYLTRGLLKAAHPARRQDLYNRLMSDRILRAEFNRGWNEVRNLTEIAFCLSFLMNVFGKEDILRLIGIQNYLILKEEFLNRIARERALFHIASGLYAAAKYDFELGFEVLNTYVSKVETELQKGNTTTESARGPRSRRNTPLPQGYEPNNIVDLSYLLQAAAAINPAQARRLAGHINIQKFAAYAVEEANLGRLTSFISGLQMTSRKMAREFIENTCSEEIWEKQYADNENLENVVQYARTLGQVTYKKAGEYMRYIIQHHKGDIQNSLEMEANLMLISNWLKALRMAGQDFVNLHIEDISKSLLSTAELDTRVRHLLETAEALIECGRPDLARVFADKALEETGQVGQIGQLQDFIVLLHKALRISRELDYADFPDRLFAKFEDWYLAAMLSFSNQAVLPAYTFYLFKKTSIGKLARLRGVILGQQSTILRAAQDERRVAHKAIALTLAEAPMADIRAAAEKITLYRAWERGLAALLFASLFPSSENLFITVPHLSEAEWHEFLQEDLNEHTGNMEFGLALQLPVMREQTGDLLEQYHKDTFERASDERIGATRWLLQKDPAKSSFNERHHYHWTIIKNTVLRPTYLTWDDDIEDENDRAAFKRKGV